MQRFGTTVFLIILATWSATRADSTAPAGDSKPGITLQAGPDGHFSGQVLINDHAMPFIIDTGATFTTIPMNMAVAARLTLGKQVETRTANGRAFDKLTRIESLKLGSAEIKNIDAHVNQHLQQVLIGMNTLKYFTLNQTADTMTLIVNEQMLKDGKLDAGVVVGTTDPQASGTKLATAGNRASKPIQKSRVCDINQHCITRYGN